MPQMQHLDSADVYGPLLLLMLLTLETREPGTLVVKTFSTLRSAHAFLLSSGLTGFEAAAAAAAAGRPLLACRIQDVPRQLAYQR
jgi:hypothetical protein